MKGIILAAGRGSRMGTLTESIPKGLVKLNGKALVDYQIDALRRGGVTEISIVTGYLSEQYRSRADRLFHNPDWQSTNMVSSLRCAADCFEGQGSVISYSDIVYGAATVRSLIQTEGDIVITYDPNWRSLWEARFTTPLDDCETFLQDDLGRLLEIGQKPRTLDEVKGQYTGLFKISAMGWKKIRDILNRKDSSTLARMDMTTLLRLLLSEGVHIQCCAMRGDWGEVDEEGDLNLYEKWIQTGRMFLAS